jgi:hypothetical protein
MTTNQMLNSTDITLSSTVSMLVAASRRKSDDDRHIDFRPEN